MELDIRSTVADADHFKDSEFAGATVCPQACVDAATYNICPGGSACVSAVSGAPTTASEVRSVCNSLVTGIRDPTGFCLDCTPCFKVYGDPRWAVIHEPTAPRACGRSCAIPEPTAWSADYTAWLNGGTITDTNVCNSGIVCGCRGGETHEFRHIDLQERHEYGGHVCNAA